MRLLTLHNPKIAKGERFRVLTGVLHLAPAELSGWSVCPFADRCAAVCLNTAGMGGIFKRGETSNAMQRARIERTRLFFEERAEFFRRLHRDIATLRKIARRRRMTPALRLNGTSDLPWERITDPTTGRTILDAYSTLQFYDYTKWPLARRLPYVPANYHLTFSLDVANGPEARAALAFGHNVAVPFAVKPHAPLPERFELEGAAYRVIDGDVSDVRFRDPIGVVVGLRAKGQARKDVSGFVRAA